MIRFGQCTAVELAVGSQRQRGQLYIGSRNHVFRQVGLQMRTHLLRPGGIGLRLAGEIGNQTYIARLVLTSQNNGLSAPRQLVQTIDNFAQLNTEATDFHLIVVASQAFQLAVIQPATQIAGAVQHGARLIAERVGNKLLIGQILAIQITQRHTVATDVKLADSSQRCQALMSVEHVNTGVADGSTDRHVLGLIGQRSYLAGSGEGGCLGGAVSVQQMQTRCLGKQFAEAGRVCALSA